ncbi:MAG: hypothetical protein ACT4PL_01565, partial [Phycisphaerales bacterium]
AVGIGSGGVLNTPFDVSEEGNFCTGLAYVGEGSGFNNFRAYRADFAAGTVISLGHLGGEGSRGNCISSDGLVIAGWDRGTFGNDRPAVWRIDAMSGAVTETVLGADEEFGEVGAMNSDGTILAGGSSEVPGELLRWTWNGTEYVRSSLGTLDGGGISVMGMSSDGSVIIGSSGGFFFGQTAFIWTQATGIVSLLDHVEGLGLTGLPDGATFAAATAISPDGTAIGVGGFFATSGLILLNGGAPCVEPVVLPAFSTTEVSRCDPTAFLNVQAAGTGPFTFQWRRNGMPIFPGPSGTGSNYATGFFSPSQLIIENANQADAAMYDCIVTNACGSMTSAPLVLTARGADLYDTCETAADFTGPGGVALPMCGAYIDQSPASCVTSGQQADVWIRYTAETAGDYRITTCGQNFYDTILSVYDTCGGPEIACSGDFCFSLASIERITLAAGQTVLVRLGAGFTPPEPVQVFFETLPPVPANDACAMAEEISGTGSFAWDTTYALNDGTATCSFNSGKDVWFRYTPAESGLVTFDTCGALLDTVLSVFDVCGGTELACNNFVEDVDGCLFQSRIVDLAVTAGTPVLVRLAANTGFESGTGSLNVSFRLVTCTVDFNDDGFVEPGDLDEFITAFFSDNEAERARCDYNGDGFVEPGDLDEFITAFFEGC